MNQHAGNANSGSLAGQLNSPGSMVLSAAIFGFFGFFMGPWITTSAVTGQFLLYVAMFNWTLQVFAIICLGSALLTAVNPLLGNLVFALTGLVCAIMFVIIAIMDFLDPSTIFPYAPFLLVFFAAWNGYGAWMALKAIRGMKPATGGLVESQVHSPPGSMPR